MTDDNVREVVQGSITTPRIRHAITWGVACTKIKSEVTEESEASIPCPSPAVFLTGLDKASRRYDDASFLKLLILEDIDDNDHEFGEEFPSKRHEVPFNSRSGLTPTKKHGIKSLDMTWYEYLFCEKHGHFS